MKNIKSYKLFESENSNIISDIEDICLDLSDNGFIINTGYQVGENGSKNSYLFIYKAKGRFKFDDVSETLKRVKEYLGDMWISEKFISRDDLHGFIKKIDVDTNIDIVEVIFQLPNTNWNIKQFNEMGYFNWSKHLNKKPELPDEVIQTIRDICLELNDMGFRVFTNQLGFNKLGKREGIYPNITIFRNGNGFMFSEIEEVVNRLTDYMDKLGYKLELKKTWVDNHGKYKQGKLFEVNIKFI